MQRIIVMLAVIHHHNEVRQIDPRLRPESVWDFETETMVLHIRFYSRVGFGNATEVRLPIAVQNDPVDMTASGISLPAVLSGSGEVHVACRANRIVRIQ